MCTTYVVFVLCCFSSCMSVYLYMSTLLLVHRLPYPKGHAGRPRPPASTTCGSLSDFPRDDLSCLRDSSSLISVWRVNLIMISLKMIGWGCPAWSPCVVPHVCHGRRCDLRPPPTLPFLPNLPTPRGANPEYLHYNILHYTILYYNIV